MTDFSFQKRLSRVAAIIVSYNELTSFWIFKFQLKQISL